MSPMSWNGGSQNTAQSSSRCAVTRWITARLCSRLACDSITPRGSAVDPDVYCNIASAPPVVPGCRHGALPLAMRVMSSQRTSLSSGVSASHSSRRAMNSGATSATRAPQSAKMRATRASARRGLGGYAGTATTPAYWQARKAAT